MNILWLTENYPPQRGGMAQSCDRIIDQLRKRGYTINILHFTSKGGSFQHNQQLNGWYASIPFEDSEAHTLNRAWTFLCNQPVSVVVCFGGYLPMLAAPVFSTWLSVPLLTMVRGNDFDSAIFTPRKRDMMRDAIEASTMVCVVSKDKAEKLHKLYPNVNFQYAPNGIDTSQWVLTTGERKFAQEWKARHSKNKICVGLFGQLKAKKGIRFLLDALRQSEALQQLHFLMIGEINEDIQHVLLTNEFSYSAYSFLDRYELLRYYACCDALAIPSFYDGMPNVLLEAGALGIPVLASNVDGMKDVIRDKQTGLLFAPGDASSCRKVFFDFLNLTTADRQHLGLQLKAAIEENYNVQLETNRYDELLKTWLGTDRPAVRLHIR